MYIITKQISQKKKKKKQNHSNKHQDNIFLASNK